MAGPDRESAATLPRVLGPFDACMVVVGSIIGSGIFLKPGPIAAALPNFGPIICVWIGVGLVTLCGCLALAELAAMLPQAGGPYLYLREAYGRLPAFLWGWTEFWVIRTGAIGALATATTIYLNEITPLNRLQQEATAIGLVVFLSLLNLVSTRWVAHVQNLATVLKVGFLALIIVLPYALGRAEPAYVEPLFPSTVDASLLRGLGMAMILVWWPYDGWVMIAPVAEEVRNPQRNVPLSLMLGVGVVILVYVLANVSYHLVLTHAEVAGSKAVASDMFRVLLGEDAAKWVALGVMCSTFGAVNANILTGPRIYFAMARDGLLPRAVQHIHSRYETPANAIIMQGVWTSLLIFLTFRVSDAPQDAFDQLTNFVVFGGNLFYALAVASVFVLRWRQPELPRPYRTWGYPFTPALYLLAFAGALVSLLLNAPGTSLAGMLLIIAGTPIYYWMRRRNNS
jgi:APA family basic amino acid/polyamine antiporter